MLNRRPLQAILPDRATKDHGVWKEIAPELTPADFRSPYSMDAHFLRLLSRIRRRAEVPFRIVSDYRDPKRNDSAGGAKDSAHMEYPCRAVDVHVPDNYARARILEAAFAEGLVRVGVYPAKEDNSGSIHLDASNENPAPRVWTRF